MATEEQWAAKAKASIIDSGFIDRSERRRCQSKTRLDGKIVVITGANTGIGKETALQLSLRGAKIYIACRDLNKANEAITDIKKTNSNADITAMALDLSSFKSVREFVKEFSGKESVIDILINNAGIRAAEESKTEDGFETDIQVNYLGPFLLTLLLLPLLKKANKARVISVSGGIYVISKLHLDNINMTGIFDSMQTYSQSKLALILFTREMARRLGKDSSVKVYAMSPGVVETEAYKKLENKNINSPIKRQTVEMGAQTTLYCALEESLDNETGFYYELVFPLFV